MPEAPQNAIRGFARQSPETGSTSLPAGHSWLPGIGINDYQAFPKLQNSRWVLCSGRNDEEVHDGPPGGNSPFTASILGVLQQHSQHGIHISKLADQVIEITRSNYRQLQEGAPLFRSGHRGGQYVFRRRGKATARTKPEYLPRQNILGPTLWILSAAFGVIFFFFTFRWIRTDAQIPDWWFVPVLILGTALYYLLLPRINARKQ